RGNDTATIAAKGSTRSIGIDLGADVGNVTFTSDSDLDVQGSLNLVTGAADDIINLVGKLNVLGNVSVNAGAGANQTILGSATADTTIGGAPDLGPSAGDNPLPR